jgi:hypothetical protein
LPIPLFEKLKMAFGIIRMRSRYSGIVDKSPRSDDQKMQELSEKTLVERLSIRHPAVKALSVSVRLIPAHVISPRLIPSHVIVA